MKYNSELAPSDAITNLLPSPTFNLVGKRICAKLQSLLDGDSTVLIVGCGEGGEGLSGFSPTFLDENVLGIDIRSTGFTDLLGDVHNLPVPDDGVDAVVCQAVLEHVPDYERAVEELLRVLRPGGYLYVDVPFMQGYHALPTDYRRLSVQELRDRFSHLEEIDSGASKGPTSTLVWLLCEYIAYLFSAGSRVARKVISTALRLLIFWVKYVDRVLVPLIGDEPGVLTVPSAVYWFGRQPLGDETNETETDRS